MGIDIMTPVFRSPQRPLTVIFREPEKDPIRYNKAG